jgi:hypothetical protein
MELFLGCFVRGPLRSGWLALKALANELLWDEGKERLVINGKVYFGRKMDTSPSNRISPDAQVTPDLLVLRSENANYVVEAKLALSKDPAKREDKLIEVQKYDDDFRGWDGSGGYVASHDIILLVRFFHGVNVRDQIAQLRADKKMRFERNFAVVTFHRVVETQTWMSLELLDGILRPKEKQDKLLGDVQVESPRGFRTDQDVVHRHRDLHIIPINGLRVCKCCPLRDLAGQSIAVDPDGLVFSRPRAP